MQDPAGEAGTSSLVMYSHGLPHMAGQKQDYQLENTFSSYVRIRDVALKTWQRRWTIGRSSERRSGISVLAMRHDNDDDNTQSKTTESPDIFNIIVIYLSIDGLTEVYPTFQTTFFVGQVSVEK